MSVSPRSANWWALSLSLVVLLSSLVPVLAKQRERERERETPGMEKLWLPNEARSGSY